MEFRQLKYFIAVTKFSKITKAAEMLNISQPSLSAQIKVLETELDVKLFDRSHKQVSLTEPGKVLYKHAIKMERQLIDCRKELEDLNQLNKGEIVIGALPTIIVSWLPNIINSFKQRYPNINITVHDIHTPEIIYSLENYKMDLGIVTYPLDNKIYNTIPFLQEELILIVPLDHKFHDKKDISMIELVNEPFILYKNDTQSRFTVLNACEQAGFNPRIVHENNRVEIVISFVSSGLGVAFVPKSSLNFSRNYKVKVIKVKKPHTFRTICLATSKNRYTSKTVDTFQDHLLSQF